MHTNFWKVWSKYWDSVEDQYLSRSVIDSIIAEIESPVLIVGAGQGLIVNYLAEKGFKVTGIDNSKEMIDYAKKRHNIDIVYADAMELPFDDKSFNTVIVASGVVDFIDDDKIIKKILSESFRVLAIHKNLYISFYKINKKLEKVYKKLGIIIDNYYYMKRILTLGVKARENPVMFAFTIKEWSKKNLFQTLVYWTILGIKLPKELKEEESKSNKIYEKALKDGIKKEDIVDAAPEKLPYRSFTDISDLLIKLGFYYNDITTFDDSYLVKAKKSYLFENVGLVNFYNENINISDFCIKALDISMQYKGSNRKALDSISLAIKKGEVFGLLGPNGAGKTTMLSILSGLIKPTSGEVIFNDKLSKDIKGKIGYIPQELALYTRLTAEENLYFFGRLYNLTGNRLKGRAKELLAIVGLLDRSNELVANFSTGMLRRLNFAIALINNPEIVLMDEPTVGIDPHSRNKIYELINLLKSNGITILYTTHYMEEVIKFCDTLAIIDRGRILLQGKPYLLLKNYGLVKISYSFTGKLNEKFISKLKKDNDFVDIQESNNILSLFCYNSLNRLSLIEKIEKITKKDDIELSLLNIEEPTLESLFLEITGRNLRD